MGTTHLLVIVQCECLLCEVGASLHPGTGKAIGRGRLVP